MHREAPLFPIKPSFYIKPNYRNLITALCVLLLQNQFVLANSLNLVSCVATGNSTQAQPQTVPTLEPHRPVERDISANETHSYMLTMSAGQYAKFVARQQGISIILKLSYASGEKIVEADTNGEAQGDEILAIVAELATTYRLDVRASNKTAPNGRYELRLDDLRPATEHDKIQVSAETALLAGDQLRAQNKAEPLRKAITKYEEAVGIYHSLNDQKGEGIALARVANAHYLFSDLPKSLSVFQQALQFFKASGEKKLEAYVLNESGLIYNSMGDKDKALSCLDQSLAITKEIGDRWGEAATINNIGLYYSTKGYKQKALEYYTQALQISREVKDRENEAGYLHNMASIYNSSGKKDKAVESYEAARAIMHAIGDKRSETVTLNSLGIITAQLGDDEKAFYYFNQSLQLAQETGNKQGQAVALNSVGNIYSARGDKHKALEYYTQSLEMRRAIPDLRGVATMLQNIGAVYSSMGDKPKGLEYLNQALTVTRSAKDFKSEATILSLIGRMKKMSGDIETALDYYNQALALSRSLSDQRSEAGYLYAIAAAERDRGNLLEAQKNIERCLEILDYVRSSIEIQEIRAAYFVTVKGYYDFYVDLLMQMHQQNGAGNYQAQALQLNERARARMLVETLIETGAKIREGIDKGLLERENELLKQFTAKADNLTRLMAGKATEAQIASAKNDVDVIRNQVLQIRSQIRTTSPRYASLTQPTPLSLTEIQKQVVDSNTLLLEYSLGETRSYLWAITADSCNSYQLPGRKEIEVAAKRVSELLTARNKDITYETKEEKQQRVRKADAEFPQAAAALSKLILSPVAKQLGTKKLLIVSDGILQYIPFAVLPVIDEQITSDKQPVQAQRATGKAQQAIHNQPSTGNYQPLIVNHEVINLPSASTLAVMRKELNGRKPAPKTIAILADPVFDTTDARLKSEIARKGSAKPVEMLAQRRDFAEAENEDVWKAIRDAGLTDDSLHLPRLPGTRREAEAIISLVPKTNLKAALDFEANRATAMNAELSNYRYVHFATHGSLNSQDPDLSGIIFSLVDEEGKPQSGFLRGRDIYNLHFPAELIVLSGCQTGLGKDIRGEGVEGLTRSFMYAGAARVMVSLWAINDEITARLMAQFYRDLLGTKKMSPAAALRAAQLAMLKDKQFSAPYYWAAFILQGEPN
jgi:CHAT domain-containing protein/tetratricopeptide (TPR) repeat protein